MERLISAKELAALLNLPTARVYRLARENRIPHFRFGKQVRFDLDAVLESANSS